MMTPALDLILTVRKKIPRPSNRSVLEAFLELETEAHGKVSACWKSRSGL